MQKNLLFVNHFCGVPKTVSYDIQDDKRKWRYTEKSVFV